MMDSNDLVSFSPQPAPHSILKPICDDSNLMVLQTPVHKHLKVSFQTPARTPLGTIAQQQNRLFLAKASANQKPKETIQSFWEDMDEDLKWKERIEVVTRADHEEYISCAKDFIEELLDKVVAKDCGSSGSVVSEKSVTDDQFKSAMNCDVTNDMLAEENKENLLSEQLTPGLKKTRLRQPGSTQTLQVQPASRCLEYDSPFRGQDDHELEFLANPFASSKSLKNSPVQKPAQVSSAPQVPLLDLVPGASSGPPDSADDSVACLDFSSENPFVSSKSWGNSSISATLFTSCDTKNPDLPPAIKEKSTQECVPASGDDGFTDATSLLSQGFDFNLDFLENKGQDVVVSDLRKQSLYLKFDPFVSKDDPSSRSLVGRKSDIIDLSSRLSLHLQTPRPLTSESKPAKPKAPDFLCDSPRTFLAPQTTSAPSKINDSVVPSHAESSEEIIEVLKYSETAMQRLITDCRTPLQSRVEKLESNLVSAQAENGQLVALMNDFVATMSGMEEEQKVEAGKKKQEIDALTKENKDLKEQMESVEKAYMELLGRSEQTKLVLNNFKTNEQTYVKAIEEFKTFKEDSDRKCIELKKIAEENQKKLVDEHEKKNHEMQSQLTALKARSKFLESQCKSLKSQMTQTAKENEELTKICDELIDQQQQRSAKS